MNISSEQPAPRPPRPVDGGHIMALDGVRALAILLVMCVHTDGFFFPPTAGNRVVTSVLGFGWVGVDLFFVLSGMLITGILLDTKGAPGYYASFYARRSLRIFPLYYVALFVFLIAAPLAIAALHHRAPVFPANQGWLWTYTTNIGIATKGAWEHVATTLTVPFWSLAVEEQFYLVWPFLVALLSRRALTRVALAMIVGALLLRVGLMVYGGHVVAVYVSTLTRMDALAAGALVALAIRSAGGLAPYRRFVAPVFAGCVAAVVALAVAARSNSHDTLLMATIGYTLIAAASTALLVGVLTAAPASRLRRAFEAPWARHVGARSYSVYIWHCAVFELVLASGVMDWAARFVPWFVVRGAIFAPLAFAAAIAAGDLSWHLVEEPFLRLKRFVPRPGPRAALARGDGRDPVPARADVLPALEIGGRSPAAELVPSGPQ